MADITINALATHHLPSFITAPGETDTLFVVSVTLLVAAVMGLGVTYFWLHSIPERLSHGTGKVQFQLVAVLSLLALFTHNNLFWIMALLLALIPIPDFWTPLASMAESLARMVRHRRGEPPKEAPVTAMEPGLPSDVSLGAAVAKDGHRS